MTKRIYPALGLATAPGWVRGFLDEGRLRNLTPRTLTLYQQWIGFLLYRYHLDPKRCTREELIRVLSKIHSEVSPGYYSLLVTVTKMVLHYLKRGELADDIPFPKAVDRDELVKKKIISPEDVKKLIKRAPTLQDRLIFLLLYETAGRRHEINGLRIKNVQFEQIGKTMTAVLWLTGKSGTRTTRVYESVPDLQAHINSHPHRDDADAKLFIKSNGEGWTDQTFYRHIRNVSESILGGKHVYPHQFRHTRATLDSKYFTDREMMMRHGWKSPQTVTVYSHLSMRDVEDKDLALRGLKRKEEILRPIIQVQVCPDCKQENAPIALFCSKCGKPLMGEREGRIQELEKQVSNLSKLYAGYYTLVETAGGRGKLFKEAEKAGYFKVKRGRAEATDKFKAEWQKRYNRLKAGALKKSPPRQT
jgi:integrase